MHRRSGPLRIQPDHPRPGAARAAVRADARRDARSGGGSPATAEFTDAGRAIRRLGDSSRFPLESAPRCADGWTWVQPRRSICSGSHSLSRSPMRRSPGGSSSCRPSVGGPSPSEHRSHTVTRVATAPPSPRRSRRTSARTSGSCTARPTSAEHPHSVGGAAGPGVTGDRCRPAGLAQEVLVQAVGAVAEAEAGRRVAPRDLTLRRRCGRRAAATPVRPMPRHGDFPSSPARTSPSVRLAGTPGQPVGQTVAHLALDVVEHVRRPTSRRGCAAGPGRRARGRRRASTPPPPGTPTRWTSGSLKPISASVVTSPTRSSRMPSAASSSSGVAGSPTTISSAGAVRHVAEHPRRGRPAWSTRSVDARRGSPAR